MKISVEEVSRLLASAPSERGSIRNSGTTTLLAREDISESPEAAAIEVSSTGQEVQQIRKLVNNLPDVREERVRALKEQVENGTYKVSGEDIADLMIRRTLADNSLL